MRNKLPRSISDTFLFYRGDDHQALICWDIQQMPRPIEDPILAYTAAEGAINQVGTTTFKCDWLNMTLSIVLTTRCGIRTHAQRVRGDFIGATARYS